MPKNGMPGGTVGRADGRTATLRDLSGGKGTGATSVRLLALAALLAAAFLALTASPALAARGHEFTRTIGTPCTAEPGPCAPGTLKEPVAVAVNETSGDVYVLDQALGRVVRVSSAGTVLGEFDGSATPAGSFQYPSTAEPKNIQVSALAVDNYCALHELGEPKCKEEDPSAGSVYVIDTGHQVIDKFGPGGGYIGPITEASGEALSGPSGIAVDREGALWLLQRLNTGGSILEHFANGEGNAFVASLEPQNASSGGFISPGLAVDGEDAFYRRNRIDEGNIEGKTFEVEKLTPSGQSALRAIGNLDTSGLAVDQRTDVAYLAHETEVTSYSTEGSTAIPLETLGEEAGAQHLTQAAGLAASAKAETIYAADRAAGQVVLFGPQLPAAPQITDQSATAVSSGSAVLQAAVNPRSDPAAEPPEGPTTYGFEYGPCAGGLASCASSPYPFRSATGELTPDFDPHPVAVEIRGLTPATAYHYRPFASNAHGATPGEELTFTTQGAASLALPDHRGYELVSPPEKHGAGIQPIAETGIVEAAPSGDALAYVANRATEAEPAAGGSGGINVLSGRGASGWSSQDLATPNDSSTGPAVGSGEEAYFFTPDLSKVFIQPFGPFTPSVTPEASEQTPYLRTDYAPPDPTALCRPVEASCYRPLVTGKEGFANVPEGTVFGLIEGGGPCLLQPRCGPVFRGATPDATHALVESNVALTEAPISVRSLYEWSAAAPPADQLRLISALPDGQPVARVGVNTKTVRGAISTDGSRVAFYEAAPGNGVLESLFLRLDATAAPSASGACDEAGRACTIQLDEKEAGCAGCRSGGGEFQFATPDGSRWFFTDTHALTADSGAQESPTRADLYECRIEEPSSGHLACALTDLTPRTATPGEEPAAVLGSVIGASTDASSIYLVAEGVLAANTVDNGAGPESATSGRPNLYRLHEGTTTYLATLEPGSRKDESDWTGEQLRKLTARVSTDGEYLAFMSQRSLTGYDNRDVATGEPDQEVYLYHAGGGGSLVCASCDPSGARPHGVRFLNNASQLVSWNLVFASPVAANIPGWVGNAEAGAVATNQPRYLSDSGRLFFNSGDALVPADSNGTQDVYEYEPPGIGTCTGSDPGFAPRNGGCLSLISSGASAQESAFLDASESGDDVFFLTLSRLTGKDVDSSYDVYDARVGGGEPQPLKPVECDGDACQQPATPPVDATPGSLTFDGAGNVKECPKGKKLSKGKCVKQKAKKHKKKHHKKQGHGKSKKHKRAGSTGGGHK